jgi:hypothetical protein
MAKLSVIACGGVSFDNFILYLSTNNVGAIAR